MNVRRKYKLVMTVAMFLLLIAVIIVACLPSQGEPPALTLPVDTTAPTVVTPTRLETAPVTTATSDPTATTAPEAPTETPTNTSEPATATATRASSAPTDVTYVMALTNLNLRSGPGLGYDVVGWMTPGQIAPVTAASSDGSWWQLVCPSGTATHCWVTAGSEYTKPQPDAARIQFAPGATSATIDGSMQGTDQVHYVFRAAAGQFMTVAVESPGDSVLFQIQGLADGQIYKGMLSGETHWQGVSGQAQDYLLALNAVGDSAAYTIHLSITDHGPGDGPAPATATATSTPEGNVVPGGPLYPVVDAESGFLLGGTQHGVWVGAQTYASYLQDTDRPYSVYTLSGEQGVVMGSPPVAAGATCAQPVVPLTPAGDLDGAVALVATWNAMPRPVQSLRLDIPEYRELVAERLKKEGLTDPDVHIDRVLSVDLDGDAVDEILIVASRLSAGTGLPPVAAGDYALLLLHKINPHDGVTTTVPLGLDVYPEANDLAYPYRYDVLGLLDLNGDGYLEILVEADRYEGRKVVVYEITSVGLQQILEAGCAQ
ncbi:MAG TPA: SH3 domain-containing protein [Candidatus Sulfomarinibacteraceae bacterium]|nr:SH3 domain-containing protein [Candidatus Sulfomarinibacteraceae bacterium]